MPEPATRSFTVPETRTLQACVRHDPGTDVDRDTADVVAHDFAFAGVHARAYVDV
jgi:hypothetical protein